MGRQQQTATEALKQGGTTRLGLARRVKEADSFRRVAESDKGDGGGQKPPSKRGLAPGRQSRIREEPAVKQGITFVGLDAHKKSINVAVVSPGGELEEWQLANERAAVKRMVRKILRESQGEVHFCYEAGPCGYALQRQIESYGAICAVVAPSLIPIKPGERIKTDRRDARKLAMLLRAELLTEVQPPSEAEESVRDLSRAREDAREDLMRCRHRLVKMLLRRAIRFEGGKRAWSLAHRRWLRQLRFDDATQQNVFDSYLLAVDHVEERLKALDAKLLEVSLQAPYAEPVAALRCFRGIDTVTAMTIVSELHTFGRFHSPRQLMAYLGLVPSERSSSDRRRLGGITKTGNSHVRRVLVEAAWDYRHRPNVQSLRKRRQGQPPAVIAVADRAMQRLHQRFTRMTRAGLIPQIAAVAIARELVGFIWAVLYPLALPVAD